MLQRLAWSSTPSSLFSAARLNEIIAPARRNNERNHISGMLLFSGAQFVSVLEGNDWDLTKLWLKLERDLRHSELIRIGEERCGERWFPGWQMAYTDHARVGPQIERLHFPVASAPKWSALIRPMMMTADSM